MEVTNEKYVYLGYMEGGGGGKCFVMYILECVRVCVFPMGVMKNSVAI